MQALMKTQKGVGFLELREMPEPTPGPGEVLIEVKASGICGTDVHILHDKFPYWPPVILGHEFAGVIAAAGKNVTGWKPGDRVVGEPHTLACGECWLCRTGNVQICPMKRSPGWGIHGSLTKFLKMPERLLHRIPDHMSYDLAALVEPTANVVTDVIEGGEVRTGDIVAVIGPGPIGITAAQAAKAAGADTVILIGTDVDEELRLPTARQLPVIDYVVNVQREDVPKLVLSLTQNRGADVVVEASGAPRGIAQGLQLVRKLGRVTAIGLTAKPEINFPYASGMFKSVTYVFNLSTSYTSWDTAIRLIASGKVQVAPFVTHRGGLDRWQEFFTAMDEKKGLKGMFVF